MFKNLVRHPVYIFKFAIYVLFIAFAFILFFSDIMADTEKSAKNIFCSLVLLYGIYRMLTTWQAFKKELREESED